MNTVIKTLKNTQHYRNAKNKEMFTYKFCFEIIKGSHIFPGTKYSTNSIKNIQSELKKYYDSNK